jgi:hypothetical protein
MLVTPALAPYLRRGLLQEMGEAATRLSELAAWDEVGDRSEYEAALWTIGAARKVLAKIGDREPRSAYTVALSRDDHPYLLYKALKSQSMAAVERSQGGHTEGRSRSRPSASGELAAAVSALRGEIAHSVSARREAKLSDPLGRVSTPRLHRARRSA